MKKLKIALIVLPLFWVAASAAIIQTITVNPDTNVTRINYEFVDDPIVIDDFVDLSDENVAAYAKCKPLENLDNLVCLSKAESINQNYINMNKESAHSAILELNQMIRIALYETGVWNDKKFTASDAYTLKEYINKKYIDQEQTVKMNGEFWKQIKIFEKLMNEEMHAPLLKSRNAVELYKWVYRDLAENRFRDLPRLQEVAIFISTLTKKEMLEGTFYNESKNMTFTSSETTLDRMIPFILNEQGLNYSLPKKDLIEAAQSSAEMNILLVKAIRELGIADNKNISTNEIKLLNKYIVANYAKEWQKAHGRNNRVAEDGFHAIQNKGATTFIRGENGINSVGDSIYHLGYASKYPNNLVNENGQKNATHASIAYWLNVSFQKVDYKNNSLHSQSIK